MKNKSKIYVFKQALIVFILAYLLWLWNILKW
jgi:hypothetical protein